MEIKRKYRHKKLFQMKKLLIKMSNVIDESKYLEPKDIMRVIDINRDFFINYCIQNNLEYEYKKDLEGYQ